jgi:CRISPR-associated endonuclease/helicase Cas3
MPEGARDLIEGVYGESAREAPEALVFSEEDYWAKEMTERSMANFNGLNMEKGFDRESSAYWDEETRIPTRLGDEQVNLYLARIVDGVVEPLYRGHFAWDQSMAKVRDGQVVSLTLSADEERLLAEYKDENNRFHKNDLIVPVFQSGDIWLAQGSNMYENEVDIKYDCHQGLTIEWNKQDEE